MSSAGDVAVIGGGIVGLATAHSLQRRFPSRRIVVVEKEPGIARHQSSHNSGVLHSGIYYRPGSLRAATCRDGRLAMVEFCEREGIRHEVCGKVIVATEPWELPLLDRIFERGQANGVRCEMVMPERLRELEPHAAGIRGIHVPDAGSVDFPAVCEALARRIREGGGEIVLNTEVRGERRSASKQVLETTSGDIHAAFVVNCGGLHSDRVAAMSGSPPDARIVPFRGEYYEVAPAAAHLCRNLIYPVPDPAFPFLGVHFTRMAAGGVECGPNAVLAFAREGYTRSTFRAKDLLESITYAGFLRLAARHWRAGAAEIWRSLSKRAFVRSLQRLVPAIEEKDLHPAPAGVRAQAITRDGKLFDDFLIVEAERMVNVCNAPSPAATASLKIGDLVADRVARQIDGGRLG